MLWPLLPAVGAQGQDVNQVWEAHAQAVAAAGGLGDSESAAVWPAA